MIVKLLTEHHLEFLSLKGGCRGLSESTHVKMSNCWKSHATAPHRVLNMESNALFPKCGFLIELCTGCSFCFGGIFLLLSESPVTTYQSTSKFRNTLL